MKKSDISKDVIFTSLDSFVNDPNFNWKLGETWYAENRQQILNLCLAVPLRGLISLKMYLAVVSILSPSNKWDENLWDANFLILHFFGIDSTKRKFRTYQTNVEKARLLLKRVKLLNWSEDHGINTALNNKTGLKTWNFYNNLLNDQNNGYLTIDRHILSICGFNTKQISPQNYVEISNILKQYWVEKRVSISLPNFQAILWCNYLNIKEINQPF